MRFAETHEWVEEKKEAKVGISTFAQSELGDIVYVELPKVGAKVRQGDELAVLESTKAAADVYSPISGTIQAVNEAVREDPSLMNQDPEGKGWIAVIELSDQKELEALIDEATYRSTLS